MERNLVFFSFGGPDSLMSGKYRAVVVVGLGASVSVGLSSLVHELGDLL